MCACVVAMDAGCTYLYIMSALLARLTPIRVVVVVLDLVVPRADHVVDVQRTSGTVVEVLTERVIRHGVRVPGGLTMLPQTPLSPILGHPRQVIVPDLHET